MTLRTRRAFGAGLAGAAVAGGLGVHAFAPDTAATDAAGDLLYALLVYALAMAFWPRLAPVAVGGITLAWCAGVELFQLTGLPQLWASAVPPIVLVLGTVFDVRDLAVYAVAAVGAALVDAFSSRRAPEEQTGQTPRRPRAFARPSAGRDHGRMPPASARLRWLPLAIAAGVLVIASLVLALVMAIQRAPEPLAAPVTASAAPRPAVTPTPTPTEIGPPADASVYDVGALPAAEVYSMIPALPVDPDPTAPFAGLLASPVSADIPVFAAPGQTPVARLPQSQRYGGSTVPVVERQTHWLRVLVAGRQGTPPEGDPGQLTGWVRAADVTLVEDGTRVEVSIAARTVNIITAAGVESVATDFGWGTDATPTPIGRTFVMHTEVVPAFGYTRGHPLVYLGVQSPTLAGFSGAPVAVTAFHYHDARSGPISNGCLRLDAAAIDRLAQLPAGTPVVITG